MDNKILTVIISSVTTFVITIFLLVIMAEGEAEIVVGDANGMNPGVIEAYSGKSEPSGYLLCDGRAVSRTTYATLFSVIGTTYGEGDGSTTFNVPNLSGRILVGKNSGTFSSLGKTGGTENTTLTVSNLPAHTHTVTPKGTVTSTFTGSNATTSSAGSHTHTYSGTTGSSGAHTHKTKFNDSWLIISGGGSGTAALNLTSWEWTKSTTSNVFTDSAGAHTHTYRGTTASSGAHTHTLTAKGTVSSTFTGSSVTTNSVGSGTTTTNLQPYIVVNYIIKY